MRALIVSACRPRASAALLALALAAVVTVWAPRAEAASSPTVGSPPGVAGPAASAPRDRPDRPSRIVEPMLADSSTIPCAPGTSSVGVLTGYNQGERTMVRLCALPNLTAGPSADESQPGTRYYITGANRHPVVNSRISGAAFALIEAAKADRIPLTATSSFRQESHQRDLFQCYVDQQPGCLQAAEPGYSVHQMGLALDFALPRSYDTCDGGDARSDPTWTWLRANAAEFGFRQLRAENWHWDTSTSGYEMCG